MDKDGIIDLLVRFTECGQEFLADTLLHGAGKISNELEEGFKSHDFTDIFTGRDNLFQEFLELFKDFFIFAFIGPIDSGEEISESLENTDQELVSGGAVVVLGDQIQKNGGEVQERNEFLDFIDVLNESLEKNRDNVG